MKRTKIIYGIGISLIIFVVIGIVYCMNFTRKLVCTRASDPFVNMEKIEKVEFRFNIIGKLKSLNEISENKYDTKELAQEKYEYYRNEFKEEKDFITITLDGNTLTLNADANIDEHKKKNRIELKNEYEGSYYECK